MGEQKKICPLLSSYALAKGISTKTAMPCIGEKCALWISIAKDMINPHYRHEYDGCGLVNTVPWKIVKVKEAEA